MPMKHETFHVEEYASKKHAFLKRAVVSGGMSSILNFLRQFLRKTWLLLIIFCIFVFGIVFSMWNDDSEYALLGDISTTSLSESPVYSAELLEVMRLRGCIADGILSGYGGDTRTSVELINRSECLYLHRALESWLNPPDFELAGRVMQTIENPNMVYGMFISEALNMNAQYYASTEGRVVDFGKMCQHDSVGFWGKDTCKSSMKSDEYRIYLRDITQKAMDMGIQSFLFGQIHFQDSGQSIAFEVVEEMRQYAERKHMRIAIGAQTNTIVNKKYLQLFDYIEGGLGILSDGSIEEKPCASRYERQGWCWALLWHKKYLAHANMALVHFDWSGIAGDDMSIFAGMNRDKRAATLRALSKKFNTEGGKVGFLYPFLTTLYDGNGGCYGAKKSFYSPDNKYLCKDEDVMNELLRSTKISSENKEGNSISSTPHIREGIDGFVLHEEEIDDAKFDDQDVPNEMVASRQYEVSVTMKNTGTTIWSGAKGYRLGSQKPQDTAIWGGRIFLPLNKRVLPGKKITFDFTVTAPQKPGSYHFQWRMIREGQGWFGTVSKDQFITVVESESK